MSILAFTLAAIAWLAPDAPEQERIADAIANAAEERPLFPNDDGRKTAALLTVTAFAESHFRRDAVGDQGRSCGLFGVWTGRSAAHCRLAQDDFFGIARVARDLLADSLAACRAYPINERLGVYLGGHCNRGLALSRYRWWLVERALRVAREEGWAS